MASLFPQAIDSFANPVYTKLDGEDVVKAAHVNDIQDAVRATQETLAGAGKTIDYASNRYIADNTSFKVVVEALDANLGAVSDDLVNHSDYTLPTDPAQHHANVIEVTPIGNLSSDRVQAALEEHQVNIDNIMTGGSVEGITLDDRYIGKTGSENIAGPLAITNDLTVYGDTILGDDLVDTLTVNATMHATNSVTVDGYITANDDIFLQYGSKIAADGAINASYILFETDKLELYTHKDIIIRLDADDATDGNADNGKFSIYNGLNNEIFYVDEQGAILAGDATFDNTIIDQVLSVGTTGSETDITSGGIDLTSPSLHVQLDKNNTDPSARFFITMDGDTGASLASPDLLLNIDENATITTGIHALREGVQETGYFGMQTYSNNAGGVFYGQGVNFKHTMANTPSSITLAITDNVNAQNISITDINQYGFFWTFDSVAVGAVRVRGTYTTIGN